MNAMLIFGVMAIPLVVAAIASKNSRAVAAAILVGAAGQALGNQIGAIDAKQITVAVSQTIGGMHLEVNGFLFGLCVGLALALIVAVKLSLRVKN